MRTITETLAEAQRDGTQKPAVRVFVRDKWPRFSVVGGLAQGFAIGAVCQASDGSVVACGVNAAGQVRVTRVTSPSSFAGWGAFYSWTLLTSSALPWPKGDVALSVNSGVLRLFYVDEEGYIKCFESTDNGVSWGSSQLVHTPWGRTSQYHYKLASGGNNDCWYTIERPGYRYIYMGVKSGGSWGGWKHVQYLMETGGEYEHCYGLAVVYDSAVSKYRVVASLDRANNNDGRIVSALWDYATAKLSGYQGIAPPGIPMAGSSPLYPCLIRTSSALGSLWLLSYVDKFSDSRLSWEQPVLLMSRDFDHWSYKVSLDFAVSVAQRLNLVESGCTIYMHDIDELYRVDLWYSGKADAEMTETAERVLRYRITEYPERGELDLELDNRDGRYDHAGVSSAAEALKPLAQVVIAHGLTTAEGAERVECRPFYFYSGSKVRERGVNLYRIYAVDGWEVLRMWRADSTIVWVDKTLRWCIAELACRVGFWDVELDDSPEWDETLGYFAVASTEDWQGRTWFRVDDKRYAILKEAGVFPQGMTGYVILRRLLSLVGGVARFGHGDSGDVLYCFIPYKQGGDPAVDYTYEDGEVLAGQYVDSFAWPTRARVVGNGVGYEVHWPMPGVACGVDFLSVYYASHLDDADACYGVGRAILDEAAARVHGGWIKARPNVGLELFDVIEITDSKAGAGIEGIKRRVSGIVTEYEPLQCVPGWMQTVYLEGV
nr:hypothetical protein [Chloroflexota bacterium]